jgi:NADPH:quinone reductase
MDHIHTRKLLLDRTKQLFDWIGDGSITVTIGGTYPLADAAGAHAAIASRATTGKLLLIP